VSDAPSQAPCRHFTATLNERESLGYDALAAERAGMLEDRRALAAERLIERDAIMRQASRVRPLEFWMRLEPPGKGRCAVCPCRK
jgi:hypothetical protein